MAAKKPNKVAAKKSNKVAAKKPNHNKQAMPTEDIMDLRLLAKILKQYDLSEVEVEQQGQRVRLRREVGTVPASISLASAPASFSVPSAPLPPFPGPATVTPPPASPAKASDDGTSTITSPFVGTFYRAPSPEASPYVEVGQTVQKGQVLCIVEAMKLMNEIETETTCKIVEILVKNAEPVEFGQPLFKVLPIA